MVAQGEPEKPKPKRRRLRRDLPPQDLAVKRMLFEKKRKDKIDYRKQLLKEWKLVQASWSTRTSWRPRISERKGTRCTACSNNTAH